MLYGGVSNIKLVNWETLILKKYLVRLLQQLLLKMYTPISSCWYRNTCVLIVNISNIILETCANVLEVGFSACWFCISLKNVENIIVIMGSRIKQQTNGQVRRLCSIFSFHNAVGYIHSP